MELRRSTTPREATSCGVIEFVLDDCDVPSTGSVMVNWKIKKAIKAWLSDASAAEATYGHISRWNTSCRGGHGGSLRIDSFNDDISAWDTGRGHQLDVPRP